MPFGLILVDPQPPGHKCFECYHDRAAPCSPCPTLRALVSGNTEQDIVPGPPGKSPEWVELFSYPIRDRKTGAVTGVVEFVRDVSEKKRLEAQLLQAQKMKAVGTLAGGIAHDFNNILLEIQGGASLALAETNPSHPTHDHLRGIEQYVKSAAEPTRQLLGFARGGKYEVLPTSIENLVRDTVEMFQRTRKDIRVRLRSSPGVKTVEVDRSQIEQVMINLLLNAWQAMPGGGDIHVDIENITLGEAYCHPHGVEPGRFVRVSVTDTGVGMSEATRKRVFEPFFTTKAMGRGTGLGLASAYGIVENHNGIIHQYSLYSEEGTGTTIDVYLPTCDSDPPSPETGACARVGGTETVLLVDDEEITVDVGRRLLERLGYRAIVARGGREAVEIYREHGRGIDLVVLDLIMPEMGGGETFDKRKELDPDVAVLLSSGYSLNGDAADVIAKGCRGFIQKPFGLDQLSEQLRRILDERCDKDQGTSST